MGVKSTRELTREQAEEKYVDLYSESSDYRRKLKAIASNMETSELEDVLQRMNDDKYGGEGFENYSIIY